MFRTLSSRMLGALSRLSERIVKIIALMLLLVILLGAIGGMLLLGIIGLFLGAVILALGYEIFMDWMKIGDGGESVDG